MFFLTVGSEQAGRDGVCWSFTGVGDSAEMAQVLSRDILSVHWARVAAHGDGAGMEREGATFPSSSNICDSSKKK